MSRPDFLPQYAAQAIVDLEWTYERISAQPALNFYRGALVVACELLRNGVHVVLPLNGEIYRSNKIDRALPTPDECDSFAGLPAPVTCFEYQWRMNDATGGSKIFAPKRITIVCDGKQTHHENTPPPGLAFCTTFFSVVFDENLGMWSLIDTQWEVPQPLTCRENDSVNCWGILSQVRSLTDGALLPATEELKVIVGEWCSDLVAVVQCCHALRAGAILTERTESSPSRRWKFEKRGVGGFTYHVINLPHRSQLDDSTKHGAHESPRLHIRRAHIRKLSSGTLTFVRQCWVGDQSKGYVDKHYKVEPRAS